MAPLDEGSEGYTGSSPILEQAEFIILSANKKRVLFSDGLENVVIRDIVERKKAMITFMSHLA